VTGQPILQARGISKHYGGLQAVSNVSFAVSAAEILGVAGPNGAGKTTLFDVITGHTRASSGEVLLMGKPVTGKPVHARARLGIARTFQQPTVAHSLTVAENMLLAASFGASGRGAGGHAHPPRERAEELLDFVGLADRAGEQCALLRVFDRKRLMLGTALAADPAVLLLDEPFGGLTPAEIDTTIGLIEAVRDRGLAVVCIEHVMRALTSLADRVLVMHHGALLFEGTPAQMLTDPQVIQVYLGAGSQRSDAG
jgi:branched-chain amino acid transport system ATP-binding protein